MLFTDIGFAPRNILKQAGELLFPSQATGTLLCDVAKSSITTERRPNGAGLNTAHKEGTAPLRS
ncbi:MAG: hypothetical protein COW55_06540 [Rhodobacteraceae bacterium CG17_big_fil_post_rev_8_21_14_2_50_65_11]|nr:MAG: hypothetical protein COW55_06540 [Rhodobacteraceae bacterium CG17_big_fil_post_rev_8_21_14_2_50_65_11]